MVGTILEFTSNTKNGEIYNDNHAVCFSLLSEKMAEVYEMRSRGAPKLKHRRQSTVAIKAQRFPDTQLFSL